MTTESTEKLFKAINDSVFSLRIEIDRLNKELDEKEMKIEELESEALETILADETIQCGIGTIEYKTPDNLLLGMVMENLDAAIQKHNALRVNEKLGLLG